MLVLVIILATIYLAAALAFVVGAAPPRHVWRELWSFVVRTHPAYRRR